MGESVGVGEWERRLRKDGMGGWIGRRVDGLVLGWADGWMDGRMDGARGGRGGGVGSVIGMDRGGADTREVQTTNNLGLLRRKKSCCVRHVEPNEVKQQPRR